MKKLYVICITMLISLIFCNNVYAANKLERLENAGTVYNTLVDYYNENGKIEGFTCKDPTLSGLMKDSLQKVPDKISYGKLIEILDIEKNSLNRVGEHLSTEYENLKRLIAQERDGIDINDTENDSSEKKFEDYTSQEIVDYLESYGTVTLSEDIKSKWKTQLENETGELELHGKASIDWHTNLLKHETREDLIENNNEEADKYTISGTVIRPGVSTTDGDEITSPADKPENYRPGEMGDNATLVRLGGIITGGLKIVGIIASVLILVILGIKYMTGTIQEKAEYKKTMIPYIVGAVFLGAGGVLIELIFNLVSGLTF